MERNGIQQNGEEASSTDGLSICGSEQGGESLADILLFLSIK